VPDRWQWGDRAPDGADGFGFRRGAVEGYNLLFGAINAVEEAFEEGFVVFGGVILSVGTHISMKAH